MYTFTRARRRTIGMRVDRRGLTIRAPQRDPLSRVESVLHQKAGWIIQKLDEWNSKEERQTLGWEEGAIFPLLGEPWRLAVDREGKARMIRTTQPAGIESRQPGIPPPSPLTSQEIEKTVMQWYRGQALTCFEARIAFYASKLGAGLPQLRLSSATTRWGSCNARGVIHLNWRLIQMPLTLVDYVVAHELSHLIEMNHSPAFWQTVARIYPNYQAARKELRRHG